MVRLIPLSTLPSVLSLFNKRLKQELALREELSSLVQVKESLESE